MFVKFIKPHKCCTWICKKNYVVSQSYRFFCFYMYSQKDLNKLCIYNSKLEWFAALFGWVIWVRGYERDRDCVSNLGLYVLVFEVIHTLCWDGETIGLLHNVQMRHVHNSVKPKTHQISILTAPFSLRFDGGTYGNLGIINKSTFYLSLDKCCNK